MRVIDRGGIKYLQHSFRKEGKVVTREERLGRELPADLEERQRAFLRACRKEAFFKIFERIRKGSEAEWSRYPPTMREKAVQQLAIGFTYNTNAIEGSTMTWEETRELVEHQVAPHKPLRDVKETERHAALFTRLIAHPETPLTPQAILGWHAELFSETKPDIAGKLRDYLVRVGGYVAPDWQEVPRLLRELFAFAEEGLHPVEHAARIHYRFERIHPFGDGNGRIGRLLMNHILWKAGYPVLVIEYTRRQSYYKALRDEERFVSYFIRRYLAAHKRYWKR